MTDNTGRDSQSDTSAKPGDVASDANDFVDGEATVDVHALGEEIQPRRVLRPVRESADLPATERFDDTDPDQATISYRDTEKLLETFAQSLPKEQQDLGSTLPMMTLKPAEFLNSQTHPLADISIRPRGIQGATEFSSRDNKQDPTEPAGELDYVTSNILGQGGMGTVFSARQVAMGREVAVKQIKTKQRSRDSVRKEFLTEAVLTGRLEHPNIVPVYEVAASSDGNLFYSMKKIRGRPWNETIAKLSLDENLRVLTTVCDAIAFAHTENVIHRDIKPQNVMIGICGEVLVVDWGLALLLGPENFDEGNLGGTPAYMAPEMILDDGRVGVWSDIYLLGAILFKIINGVSPHPGTTAKDTLVSVRQNIILSPDQDRVAKHDPSGELMSIAMRAMETAAEDRFASVTEFQEALRGFDDHRESLELSARARIAQKTAEENDNHSNFSKAVFGYEEAIELWPANKQARESLTEAKLAWARCAERQGDFELGLSLLDESQSDQVELIQRMQVGREERNHRQARLKSLRRYLTIGTLVALVSVSVVGSIAGIQWYKTEAARQDEAGQRAEAAKQHAQAVKEHVEAGKQHAEADRQRAEAVKQHAEADRQREEALKQHAFAEQNLYGAEMLLAKSDWNDANIRRLRETLGKYEKNDELRGFEWDYWHQRINGDLRTLRGHTDAVWTVAISPDKKKIASGSTDKTAKVWDTTTGKIIVNYQQHTAEITNVAFHPNGQFVASASRDGTVRVWNTETGEDKFVLKGHKASVKAVAFSADGKRLASSDSSGFLCIWNGETGESIIYRQANEGEIKALAFSNDGRYLATCGVRTQVKIWDTIERTLVGSHQMRTSKNYAVTFSPDGKQIAIGGRTIEIRDINDPEPRLTIDAHKSFVYGVAFTPDGKKLVSASQDGTVRVFDAASGEQLNVLKGHSTWILAMDLSVDGSMIASASSDHTVKLWSVDQPSAELKTQSTTGELDYLGNNHVVATRGMDAQIWDVETRSVMSTLKHPAIVRSVAVNADFTQIATGTSNGVVRVWDAQTHKELRSFKGHVASIVCIKFSPDGKQVASSGYDRTARVWDLATGEVSVFRGHQGYVNNVAFSPDGQRLATASHDTSAYMWDLNSKKRLFVMRGHSRPIQGIEFSPNGEVVATSSGDGTINIYDSKAGEIIRRLQGHSDGVMDIEFSPNGMRLLSASQDGTAKLWNPATGQELLTMPHDNFLMTAAFSPDGEQIATGGSEEKIRLWTARSR
jgi:WD40 repeat protein/serine/threonine protein kinase